MRYVFGFICVLALGVMWCSVESDGICRGSLSDYCAKVECPTWDEAVAEAQCDGFWEVGTCEDLGYVFHWFGLGDHWVKYFDASGALVAVESWSDTGEHCDFMMSNSILYGPVPHCDRCAAPFSATDDPSAATCYGGDKDGESCTTYAQCPGDVARCEHYDNDCMREVQAANIRFVVDPNPDEGCANVTVLADGGASAHILNLSDDGCASGQLGTIPVPTIWLGGGSLENTVVRMTVSSAGFSHGQLGAVMEADLALPLFGIESAVAVHLSDINASAPPTQDASAACNGVSATFVIGGIAQ